jgi:hypothetical protein
VAEGKILSGGPIVGRVALRFIIEADSSEHVDRTNQHRRRLEIGDAATASNDHRQQAMRPVAPCGHRRGTEEV